MWWTRYNKMLFWTWISRRLWSDDDVNGNRLDIHLNTLQGFGSREDTLFVSLGLLCSHNHQLFNKFAMFTIFHEFD